MLAGAVAFMLAGALSSCGSSAAAPGPAAPRPTLRFHVITKTTQKLDSIVWTGRQFLYVQNTTNTVWAAPPAGRPLQQFATMPRLVEETRCILSPGSQGFPPGAIFCHSPDNKIYEISPDGSNVTMFASLPAPYPPAADGALAFDRVGRFGYRLLAATGRSGGAKPAGGLVYAIDAHGHVQQRRQLRRAGGRRRARDRTASIRFGRRGRAPHGRRRRERRRRRRVGPQREDANDRDLPASVRIRSPRSRNSRAGPGELALLLPGLYLNDDKTGYTYMAPAASLARYAGDVIVGTESPRALFWILKPRGNRFAEIPLRDNLPAGTSLEQAIFVR